MEKILLTTTAAILLTAATVLAQTGSAQDGMMGTEHGWGMGYGWGFWIIPLIIVVLGAAYFMKKK
jgi:hypothetical protein